jgi:hypothetical protein
MEKEQSDWEKEMKMKKEEEKKVDNKKEMKMLIELGGEDTVR